MRARSYQNASLCIERTIGDRFNIILWAVPVSRRAVGSKAWKSGWQESIHGLLKEKVPLLFLSKSGGVIVPLHPNFDGPAPYRVEADNEWLTKEDRSYCDTINRDELLFSNEVSFFPRFKYHFFLYTISFFSYREKRNASKILISQPLLLYVWAKFSKFNRSTACNCKWL